MKEGEGKLPPQACDLEEAILGSIMLEKKGAYIGLKMMSKGQFYKENNQLIFNACELVQLDGDGVDILTVINKLRKLGDLEQVGGASYVSGLTDRIASSSNIEFQCRVVQEKWLSRELIKVSSSVIQDSYNEGTDVFNLVSQSVSKLHDATREITGGQSKDLKSILDELNERIEANLKGIIPGVPTGATKYDENSGGQQKGNMIIYAARPGMGKTARACNEMHHQLKLGLAVIFHSLEMTEVEMVARILGLELNIPPAVILRGKIFDMKAYKKAVAWLASTKLTILTDTSLKNIIIESHIIQSTVGCDIMYVDYIQLVKAGYHKPIDEVSAASRDIKQLAKDMEIPIIAIAQLSRAVETRGGDRKPILSDLKESGQLEQDADVVEFIYRPEYYNINQDEDGNSMIGVGFYVNAKFRGGKPGLTIQMKWDGPINRFSDYTSTLDLPEPNDRTEANRDFDGEKQDLPF